MKRETLFRTITAQCALIGELKMELETREDFALENQRLRKELAELREARQFEALKPRSDYRPARLMNPAPNDFVIYSNGELVGLRSSAGNKWLLLGSRWHQVEGWLDKALDELLTGINPPERLATPCGSFSGKVHGLAAARRPSGPPEGEGGV